MTTTTFGTPESGDASGDNDDARVLPVRTRPSQGEDPVVDGSVHDVVDAPPDARQPDPTRFVVELDESPELGGAAVDLPAQPGVVGRDRRPILPEQWAGLAQARATALDLARHTGHVAAYHAVRLPWYTLKTGAFAVAGAGRLSARQVKWWWVAEQHAMRQRVAEKDDPMTWLRLHQEVRRVRVFRGVVVLLELLALVFGVPVVWAATPWWALTAAVGGGALALACAAVRRGTPSCRLRWWWVGTVA
jgi:hypothetical protein